MKLRILDNSIRLRLSQTEVRSIGTDGIVSGRTAFAGGATFDYVLESSPSTLATEATIVANVLTVRVPQDFIGQWTGSDQVSIKARQQLDRGEALSILIEKDFACLEPREGEDESDLFVHPEADRSSC